MKKYPIIENILKENKVKVLNFTEKNGWKDLTICTEHLGDTSWNQDKVADYVSEICTKIPWKASSKIRGLRGSQVTITFRGNK